MRARVFQAEVQTEESASSSGVEVAPAAGLIWRGQKKQQEKLMRERNPDSRLHAFGGKGWAQPQWGQASQLPARRAPGGAVGPSDSSKQPLRLGATTQEVNSVEAGVGTN